MTLRRATLAEVDVPRIAAAYNTVYTGYAQPVRFDVPAMRRLLHVNDIVRDASPLWFEGGDVAALASIGLRGDAAYVGGFGIAPAYRGGGLAHELLQAALDGAHARGARHIELEVLTDNTAAIAAYTRGGFITLANVTTYVRLPCGHITADERDIGPADPLRLMDIMTERAGTTWQNRFASLRRYEGLEALVAGDPERPDAYVIFREGSDSLVLCAFGGESAVLARTLASVIATVPYKAAIAVNVAQADVAHDVLPAIGFAERGVQHVMAREL